MRCQAIPACGANTERQRKETRWLTRGASLRGFPALATEKSLKCVFGAWIPLRQTPPPKNLRPSFLCPLRVSRREPVSQRRIHLGVGLPGFTKGLSACWSFPERGCSSQKLHLPNTSVPPSSVPSVFRAASPFPKGESFLGAAPRVHQMFCAFAGRFRGADAPPKNSTSKNPPCLLPPSPPCFAPRA